MILASLATSAAPVADDRASLDVVYRQVEGWRGQLDIRVPVAARPRPALIYFHGGGWRGGSRKAVTDHLAPYLARGFVVIAVSYRGAQIALAPAAVTDARCALHWVMKNAARYRIDKARIVLSGHADYKSTTRYSHLANETLLSAVEAGASKLSAQWAT